jgi:hypothetical protein
MGDGIDFPSAPSGTSSMWLENAYIHDSLSTHVGLKLHRTPDYLSNVRVYNNYYGLQVYYGVNNVTGTNLVFANNTPSDIIMNYGSGRDNITLINPTPQKPTIASNSFTSGVKLVLCKSEWDLNIKNSSGSGLNASVFVKDSTGLPIINLTADSNGNIPTQKVLYTIANGSTGSTAYSDKTPHTVKYRKYGYQFSEFSKTFGTKGADNVVLNNNLFVVASEANANYTGIDITGWQNKTTINQSVTLQQLYDYSELWASSSINMQYDEPLYTADGTNFVSNYNISLNASNISTMSQSVVTFATGIKGFTAQSRNGTTVNILYHPSVPADWPLVWYADNGTLFRNYTLNVSVVDNLGNPVSNANVTLVNIYGRTVFSINTSANGQIPMQSVNYALYNYTGNDTFSPFTLTVYVLGSSIYSSTIALDRITTVTVTYQLPPTGPWLIRMDNFVRNPTTSGWGFPFTFNVSVNTSAPNNISVMLWRSPTGIEPFTLVSNTTGNFTNRKIGRAHV